MAWGLSKAPFALKEHSPVEIGSITDPSGLDPDATDPDTLFTALGDVGYRRQGTLSININDTRAEALAGTPAKVVRDDLVQRDVRVTFELFQWTIERFAKFLDLETSTGATREWAWLGSDVPTPTTNAYRLVQKLTNDEVWTTLIWQAKVVTEDRSLTFAGTDYATLPAEIRAFPEDNFEALPTLLDTRNFGLTWRVL